MLSVYYQKKNQKEKTTDDLGNWVALTYNTGMAFKKGHITGCIIPQHEKSFEKNETFVTIAAGSSLIQITLINFF